MWRSGCSRPLGRTGLGATRAVLDREPLTPICPSRGGSAIARRSARARLDDLDLRHNCWRPYGHGGRSRIAASPLPSSPDVIYKRATMTTSRRDRECRTAVRASDRAADCHRQLGRRVDGYRPDSTLKVKLTDSPTGALTLMSNESALNPLAIFASASRSFSTWWATFSKIDARMKTAALRKLMRATKSANASSGVSLAVAAIRSIRPGSSSSIASSTASASRLEPLRQLPSCSPSRLRYIGHLLVSSYPRGENGLTWRCAAADSRAGHILSATRPMAVGVGNPDSITQRGRDTRGS